jgi:phosphatidate cytidylyltransferase
MPFNLQTFKTRSLTAIVFVVVMLVGLFLNFYSFLLLFSIINFGCWLEYQKLVRIIDPNYKKVSIFHKYGIILLGWSLMLCATDNTSLASAVTITSIGWWLLIVLIITLPAIDLINLQPYTFKNLGYSFLGLLYISVSWALMINIRNRYLSPINHGLVIPLILIASIWINDTMAYIVGSLIGKTPLSSISPKKTREGTLGGALLAILVVTLIGHFAFKLPVVHLIMISAIATITGTIGDLMESKLKRLAGVKDSGEIMPGHGGFLDRFDSLLLATPFVWLYVYFTL